MSLKRPTIPLFAICLGAAVTLLVPRIAADEQHAKLADHGITPGNAEAILPGNALIHARIQNVQSILENVESLLINTVPEKLLPPPIRPIFHAERPLLTLLGMPLLQAPLTSEALAERVGLDSEAPLTVTLYPGDPTRFFIASVGMADPSALSQALSMIFRPEQIEATSIGGRQMLRIQSRQIPIGSLFISCSEDRAYITGEPSLLIHLHEPGTVPSLKDDPHMGQVLQLVKKKDVAVSINPSIIKPLTSQIPFFKYVPLSFLSQARSEFLRNIPEGQRKEIEQQIERQFGISSIEDVMDYAECFIAATYEHLFNTVYSNIDGLNGATFALRISNDYPELSFLLHHDQIQPSNDTRSIPLAAVNEALGRLGQTTHQVSVSGRQPSQKPSAWVSEWIDLTRRLMVNKGLDTKVIDTIQSLHQTTHRPDKVEAQVPWSIQLAANVNPKAPLKTFNSLEAYLGNQQENAFVKSNRQVTILPGEDTAFLKQHFQSQITAQEANRDLTQQVFRQNNKPQLILTEQRLMEESLPDQVSQFTLENAYISRTGLFGYNQHEFINRKIYLAKRVEDYLVYHQASQDASWLNSLGKASPTKESYALQHLIARVPRDANEFSAFRGLGHLIGFVDWIQEAEALVHRDIQGYLEKIQEIAAVTEDRDELIDRIQTVNYSPMVASINQDEAGKFYCLLPGNITFPRAKMTPILGEILGPFRTASKNRGGLLAYTRTLEGTKEWSLMWNTEGVSTLIQSVGNTIAEKFLENPQRIQEVMQLAINERDRNQNRMNEVIAKNPAWRFLDQIQLPRPVRAQVQKVPARPAAPIEARSAEATNQQIDLTSFFNGSLNETWHRGGIENNDLSELPQGLSTIGGVDYDLRGVIQLSGQGAQEALSVEFPRQATGIKINQTAKQLHFLHACGWNDAEGTRIATYTVHYEDGESIDIPIEYGIHLRDWWSPTSHAEVPNGDIAWIGSNGASTNLRQSIQLYHLAWNNPKAGTPITSLDFQSEMAGAAPFLLAVTVNND